MLLSFHASKITTAAPRQCDAAAAAAAVSILPRMTAILCIGGGPAATAAVVVVVWFARSLFCLSLVCVTLRKARAK